MATVTPRAALSLRNVLVATDFSSCSERALLHAVAVAHHFGSMLHVVHVVNPTVFTLCPPEGYIAVQESTLHVSELARDDARNMMASVLRQTHCEDVKFRTHVDWGITSEMLCAEIEQERIDLAVVGTHAKRGLRRLVMGSVAEEVFRHAPCPVLTVGPNSWRSDPQTVQLKHILFPTDLSADSQRAVPLITAIAAEFKASLTVMHVIKTMSAAAANDAARVISDVEQRMREMIGNSVASGIALNFRVEFGDIVSTVLEVADRTETDLIAFGLRAPDYYADRLPWLHAYDVICEAHCPVLSLRGLSLRN